VKLIALALLLAAAPGLKKCPVNAPETLPVSEACEVIKRTLYPNGRFKLSSKEVEALSEENQKKLAAVKLYFRQCPQAKAMAGAT
jgi:hypothetical protein